MTAERSYVTRLSPELRRAAQIVACGALCGSEARPSTDPRKSAPGRGRKARSSRFRSPACEPLSDGTPDRSPSLLGRDRFHGPILLEYRLENMRRDVPHDGRAD